MSDMAYKPRSSRVEFGILRDGEETAGADEAIESTTTEVVEQKQEEAKMVEQQPAEKKVYALSRCRYKSGKEIVTAERWDEIKDCDRKDMRDLIEHNCVEELDSGQLDALKNLQKQPRDKREKLLAVLGLLG